MALPINFSGKESILKELTLTIKTLSVDKPVEVNLPMLEKLKISVA